MDVPQLGLQHQEALAYADVARLRGSRGGHINHSLFWKNLAPSAKEGKGPGGVLPPSSALAAAVTAQYGSLEGLTKAITAAALGEDEEMEDEEEIVEGEGEEDEEGDEGSEEEEETVARPAKAVKTALKAAAAAEDAAALRAAELEAEAAGVDFGTFEKETKKAQKKAKKAEVPKAEADCLRQAVQWQCQSLRGWGRGRGMEMAVHWQERFIFNW